MSHQPYAHNSFKRARLSTHKTAYNTDLQFLGEVLSWPLDDLQRLKSQYDATATQLIKQYELNKTGNNLRTDFDSIRQYQHLYTQLQYNNVLADLLQHYTQSNVNTTKVYYTLNSINGHSTLDYIYYIELVAHVQHIPPSALQRGDLLVLHCPNEPAISQLMYLDNYYARPGDSVCVKCMITLSSDIENDTTVLALLRQRVHTYFTVEQIDVNVTSYMREHNAIQSIEQIRIATLLIQPRQAAKQQDDAQPHIDRVWNHALPSKFRQHLSEKLNAAQLCAVQTAAHRALTTHTDVGNIDSYVTLLVGPPGTGKSKTATAMLNTLHVSQYSQHYESIIDMLLHSMHSQAAAHLKHKLQAQQQSQAQQAQAYQVIDLTTQHYTEPINNRTQPIVLSGSNDSLQDILESMPRPSSTPASAASNTRADTSDTSYQPRVQPKPRFLVCAPSNTAVDELISRALNSFVDGTLHKYKPDIVRVGVGDSMRSEIKQVVSLDAIVDNYLNYTIQRLHEKIHAAKVEIQRIDKQMFDAHMQYYKLLQAYEHKLQQAGNTSTMIRPRQLTGQHFISNIVQLHETRYRMHVDVQRWQIAAEYNQLQQAAAMGSAHTRVGDTPHMSQLRDQLRLSILNTTHIVFSTLSGSSLDLLTLVDRPFDVLLVDEAANAVECSTLIALKHNAAHTILIGDTNQLPAITFDKLPLAKQYYERSLFERLQHATHTALSLNIQYRMHPQVALFPSKHFYGHIGGLLNGDNVCMDTYTQAYHNHLNYKPFLLWNVPCNKVETNRSGSLYNQAEATFIVKVLINLLTNVDSTVQPHNIVVITFYAYHRHKLRLLIDTMASSSYDIPMSDTERQNLHRLQHVEMCTVDSYQGRENDIVIISCVRSGIAQHSEHSMGFVRDVRRMNVSLTRGKYACWVVGDARALQQDENWSQLLDNAKQRGLYREAAQLELPHNDGHNVVRQASRKHGTGRQSDTQSTTHTARTTIAQSNGWVTTEL